MVISKNMFGIQYQNQIEKLWKETQEPVCKEEENQTLITINIYIYTNEQQIKGNNKSKGW